MKKRFFFYLALVIGLLLFLGISYSDDVAVSAEASVPEDVTLSTVGCEPECGGGSWKDDNWPDSKSSVSMLWADTPGFDCTYGVESVTFDIKAGPDYHDPNGCYGASWDQNGWSVWENWTGEGDKGDCKDISHVIVNWTCKCPVPECEDTIEIPGEWSDWEIDPENPTRECHTQHVKVVDAYDNSITCDEYDRRECRSIVQEFSIATKSWCVDDTTMSYETVVHAPLGVETEGYLATLWYYPNGSSFVTGETGLGMVPIFGGDNVFTSTMTEGEILAAIGENNLSGGNPANDFMYDHLDLYLYDVRIYFGEERLTSNMEPLWKNCGEGVCCKCPECGAPLQETMGESMAIDWFSDVPCTSENCWKWYEGHNPIVKVWTRIKNYIQHRGELLAGEEIIDANGEVCYVTFFRDGGHVGDFILWGPEGIGDRIRDHFPASDPQPHKYSSCSIYPSWCDTRLEDGVAYAIWLPGHNTSDWALFLLNNGFFPDEQYRGTATLEWAAKLREEGKLELPPR